MQTVKFQKMEVNKRNGFTLIEMILVLGLISLIILLAAPIKTSVLKIQEEEKFIQTFKEDVLFIQNQASRRQRGIVYIRFYTNYYIISNGHHSAHEGIIKRDFPKGWEQPISTLKTLQFHESGAMLQPRTIVMYSDEERIVFTFPLGKGRFHVGKEKRVHND